MIYLKVEFGCMADLWGLQNRCLRIFGIPLFCNHSSHFYGKIKDKALCLEQRFCCGRVAILSGLRPELRPTDCSA